MSKNPPEAPDPRETAGAQTANNIGTAVANQVMGSTNQITPTGNLTYYFNGPNGELIAPGDYQGGSTYQQPQAAVSTPSAPSAPAASDGIAVERGHANAASQAATADPTASSPQAGSTTGGTAGSFQWTDPNTGQVYDIPQMTAVTSLSDSEQGIFDATQGTRQNLADLGQTVSGQMQNHFANPFSLDGLPTGGSASNIRTPDYQGLTGLQRMNTQGPESRSGDFSYGFEAPQISGGIAGAGEILREFGGAGEITKSYGGDYSEDRRRVEEALMSRLNPSLEQDKEALRTSLLNQGIREGSTAYDRAMNRANEQSTDARMQAILAGGQEQSRLDDLEARRAGFENAAQQQQYEQLYGRAAFSNAGQQQQFGQNRDSAALSLQAQIANSNQAAQQAQINNSAVNSAFGQDMASATFGNNAIGMNNALEFQTANFGNNLADRNFQNDFAMQDRMDADRSRALQETMLMRNQPINEIGALLGTGQVQMPNFVNTGSPQIPTVDRAGLEQSSYQAELDAWKQKQATMGGLLGTAGTIGAGFI